MTQENEKKKTLKDSGKRERRKKKNPKLFL